MPEEFIWYVFLLFLKINKDHFTQHYTTLKFIMKVL